MKAIHFISAFFALMLVTLCCSAQDHPFVDLGLPSGTLWAKTNIGADNPEDYGNHYAWGEISTKNTYDWATYNYTDFSRITLDVIHDVAYQEWGKDWCLPTLEQCQELYDKCKWKWTTLNGKNGYLLTGPNGNTLFLPAGGWKQLHSGRAGSFGFYWTSTIYQTRTDGFMGGGSNAYCLAFNSEEILSDYYGARCYGCTIRAVRWR